MSHGKNGYVSGTDLERIKLTKLQHKFDGTKCDNLRGKPKLFFYQMCRLAGMCTHICINMLTLY